MPQHRSIDVSDDYIRDLIKEVGLYGVVDASDPDREQDWTSTLAPRQQQLLVIAAILVASPRYVLMEKGDVIFGRELLPQILNSLAAKSITCMNFGEPEAPRTQYDAVLEYHADGSWQWIDQRGNS